MGATNVPLAQQHAHLSSRMTCRVENYIRSHNGAARVMYYEAAIN